MRAVRATLPRFGRDPGRMRTMDDWLTGPTRVRLPFRRRARRGLHGYRDRCVRGIRCKSDRHPSVRRDPGGSLLLREALLSSVSDHMVRAHLSDLILSGRRDASPAHAGATVEYYRTCAGDGALEPGRRAISVARANTIARSRQTTTEAFVREQALKLAREMLTLGPSHAALTLLVPLSVPARDGSILPENDLWPVSSGDRQYRLAERLSCCHAVSNGSASISTSPRDQGFRRCFRGGPRGARTHDPRIKSPMLYRLS